MEVTRHRVNGTNLSVSTVDDALSDTTFDKFRAYARKASFIPVPKGNGTELYCAPIPLIIKTKLHEVMGKVVGVPLQEITSFLRLNTATLDTEFRVHCDNLIQGQRPDYASVFYLDDSVDSGTALFKHPEHGLVDNSQLKIFDEDDGKWEEYWRYYAVANTMLIYPASMFHGRFPWKSSGYGKTTGRIVAVSFMKVRLH